MLHSLANTTLNYPKGPSDENVSKLRQGTTSERRVKEKDDVAINPFDRQKKTETPSDSNAKTVDNTNPIDNDKSLDPIIDTEPVASRTRSHSQAKIKESSSTDKPSINNKSKSTSKLHAKVMIKTILSQPSRMISNKQNRLVGIKY